MKPIKRCEYCKNELDDGDNYIMVDMRLENPDGSFDAMSDVITVLFCMRCAAKLYQLEEEQENYGYIH